MLEAKNINLCMGDKHLLENITLSVQPGTICAVVGPNGAGKTTLLRLLSGEISPSQGETTYLERSLSQYSAADLALQRAYLTQNRGSDFPFTAYEIVSLGRLPHEQTSSAMEDERITMAAMETTQCQQFSNRTYATLSGGESSRVDFARLLAQEPALLLLDEPNNHLDVKNQFNMFSLCRSLTQEGVAVIMAIHDLNMAAYFADQVLVLKAGREVIRGTAVEVFTRDLIGEVFEYDCEIWQHPSGCPWIVPKFGLENKETADR